MENSKPDRMDESVDWAERGWKPVTDCIVMNGVCAWCGTSIPSDREVFWFGATANPIFDLTGIEGPVIELLLSKLEKPIPAMVATSDSQAKADGYDFMFMACSQLPSGCWRWHWPLRLEFFPCRVLEANEVVPEEKQIERHAVEQGIASKQDVVDIRPLLEPMDHLLRQQRRAELTTQILKIGDVSPSRSDGRVVCGRPHDFARVRQ